MGNIKQMNIKNGTPVERLEKLVANEKLTCDEVISFLNQENYILINRIATENPDEFYPEYAEFLEFYFDVFGPNEDFLDFVDEYYGDSIPFLFEFSDDCCRRHELDCMSDTQRNNARTLADYVMKINAKKSLVAYLSNDIIMTLDLPEDIAANELPLYRNDVEGICMHLACFGGQMFLAYTDNEEENSSVLNGFISLDGILANLSANNMLNSYRSFLNTGNEKPEGKVRFETASCIFKKPQYGKPKEETKDKDDKDNGKILRFPNNRLN